MPHLLPSPTRPVARPISASPRPLLGLAPRPLGHRPSDAERATLAFYNAHAARYAAQTRLLPMEDVRTPFLACLPAGARVLDAGCGSGRDSLAFQQAGFQVTASDASPALAAEATRLTGLPVRVARHQDLTDVACYDGIYASATLLHVPFAEWPDVLARFARALTPLGVLLITIKAPPGLPTSPLAPPLVFEYGDAEGRHFTTMDRRTLCATLAATPGLQVGPLWITPDATRPDTRWIGVLAQRLAP